MSQSLFGLIRAVAVVGRGRFNVKDSFVKDMSDGARPKIFSVGENFMEWFGDMAEEARNSACLYYAKLLAPSSDDALLAALVPRGPIPEVALSQVFGLTEAQPNGEKGALLVNNRANVLYATDRTGTRRAVCPRFHGGGWCIDAHRIDSPRKWGAGSRVFWIG